MTQGYLDLARGFVRQRVADKTDSPSVAVDDLDAGRSGRARHEERTHPGGVGDEFIWTWRPPTPDEQIAAPGGFWTCPPCDPSPAGTDAATWERPDADPRPDLVEDTALWSRLLADAWALDADDPAGLFGGLHGLRALGARLDGSGGKGRLLAGSIPAASYAVDRARWLLPHAAALSRLLAALSPEEMR